MKRLALLAALALVLPASALANRADERALQREIDGLVSTPGGPPGAIVTLYRNGHTRVFRAGYADVRTRRSPRASDHMRIASVAKTFSGAVAFHLVAQGHLGLGDTIGRRLPGLPRAWARVTVRQLLDHTSGLPDYTQSAGFRRQFETAPGAYVSPAKIIGWVRSSPLVFRPGSSYAYSNTDNIVVGLIAERITHRSYGRLLRDIVFRPLRLHATSLPSRPALPAPFIHGYIAEVGHALQDVSTLLSPSGAWASGGVVSTPNDLNAFIRSYLSGRLISPRLQRQQLRFIPGAQSSPAGPGFNAAGLAIFRYRTRCGTVYGHTGNFPGYVQFAAATRDGRRAVTTSLNIPAPTGALLRRLREAQTTAVCALLR